ncbi:ADP-ribosylarginine hydrolase CG3568-like isoform X2 [Choristoneura fumiferana]
MDILRHFQNIAWCKPDWCYPSMSKETNELLHQCIGLPRLEYSDDVEEAIKRSEAFPIEFPIHTMRLKSLKTHRPVDKLKSNIASTYPLIHERVLLLMTHFLIYKREFGSAIEKALYRVMTVPELIDRILKKRAISFMNSQDQYKLLTGEEDEGGWETVGTLQQKPPLTLDNCLSYDELKLSSMVYVSGHTECINDGNRYNAGQVAEEDIESDAVIIGIIGPRFERKFRMEYEDILITEQQNCLENGYGEEVTPTTCLHVLKTTYVRNNQSARHMWRQIWSEFYQVHSYTYEELTSYVNIQQKPEDNRYVDRYVKSNVDEIFDNEVYYKRISVTAECVLLEGEERGRQSGRDVFINVIGAGLGVWKISAHQADVYVLTFLERVRSFLKMGVLNHVTDVNFAYIKPSASILGLFTNITDETEGVDSTEKRIFFESKRHPKGGINVQLENREPSAKLTGEHAGKLLVITYPWDGNAFPGNEFWLGSLTGSGDPAAACSTQITELHNPYINPRVDGNNARVAGRAGVATLADYCERLST